MFVRSLTPMAKLSVWPQVQEQLQIRPPKKSRRPLQIQRQRQVQNANREIGVPRGAGLTLWQPGAQPFEPALPVRRAAPLPRREGNPLMDHQAGDAQGYSGYGQDDAEEPEDFFAG